MLCIPAGGCLESVWFRGPVHQQWLLSQAHGGWTVCAVTHASWVYREERPMTANAEPAKHPICTFWNQHLVIEWPSNNRQSGHSPTTTLHPLPDFLLLYPQEMLTKNTRQWGWVTAGMVKGWWEQKLNLALLWLCFYFILWEFFWSSLTPERLFPQV